MLTQNPGPGRSADADFEPFHFPCKPSPGIFAAHSLRKFADASPRQPSPRAHEVDSVREKPSGAHGTRKSSVPYARETLVRTEPAACARRCFTTPHCSTGRRGEGGLPELPAPHNQPKPPPAHSTIKSVQQSAQTEASLSNGQSKPKSAQTAVTPRWRGCPPLSARPSGDCQRGAAEYRSGHKVLFLFRRQGPSYRKHHNTQRSAPRIRRPCCRLQV